MNPKQMKVRVATRSRPCIFRSCTITRITTQGRFNDLTISMATEVLPEPELPAMPMMLKSCHGGAYRGAGLEEIKGEIDSMSKKLSLKTVPHCTIRLGLKCNSSIRALEGLAYLCNTLAQSRLV
jgi:hypothetical protein